METPELYKFQISLNKVSNLLVCTTERLARWSAPQAEIATSRFQVAWLSTIQITTCGFNDRIRILKSYAVSIRPAAGCKYFLTIRPALLFCTPTRFISGQGRCPGRLCHVPER